MDKGLAIVLMGVAGCGKTTVGRLLAAELGCGFVEGDDFHSAAEVAKMSAGVPLDDSDRQPWLEQLAGVIAAATDAGRTIVLACSALKASYRRVLAGGGSVDRRIVFVHLAGPQELVAARLAARKGHFFPRGLLASQYADLEPLPPGEMTVSIAGTPQAITARIVELLGRRGLILI